MIKVVWLCHFTNSKVQQRIKVRNPISAFAPWITLSIEEIKKRIDIELHVISPHRWISGIHSFSEGNVNYYFFNPGIPLYGRHWPGIFRFDYWTNFYFNRKKIRKIIQKINPDLINLHGVENPYYSYAILDYKDKYPILITIQGLKSLNVFNLDNWVIKKDIDVEQRLLKEFDEFGIRVKFLREYIQGINNQAKFYYFKYPFGSEINLIEQMNSTYDCVFFARISKDKGIEDLIEAIKILKIEVPNIKLKIVGDGDSEYIELLKNRIILYQLKENIDILGFFENHSDVYKIVAQAKISVLPTYNDILPGTIIESLRLGIPVVAYAANGVVDFNVNREVVKLVELGNIKMLAEEILIFLKNPELRNVFSKLGKLEVNENFNNGIEIAKLIDAYHDILSI